MPSASLVITSLGGRAVGHMLPWKPADPHTSRGVPPHGTAARYGFKRAECREPCCAEAAAAYRRGEITFSEVWTGAPREQSTVDLNAPRSLKRATDRWPGRP